MDLFLDVGGTNVRLENSAGEQAIYSWGETPSLPQAIVRFAKEAGHKPNYENLVLAMAGLVIPGQEELAFTNVDRPFSRQQLSEFAQHIHIINDFAAQAALIPEIGEGECLVLKLGKPTKGPRAVVGPGTGLGVAGINAAGDILPGEGGHVALPYLPNAPRSLWDITDEPLRLEDVQSGQGLERLYRALNPGTNEPTAEDLSCMALSGESVAIRTFDLFFDFLAIACANQALQYNASGGIFVVGDIVGKNHSLFNRARFAQVFAHHASHQDFLAGVPVYYVNQQLSGLAGAQAYLKQKLRK